MPSVTLFENDPNVVAYAKGHLLDHKPRSAGAVAIEVMTVMSDRLRHADALINQQ